MSHESSLIKKEPKKVLKNAGFMSAGTLLSRILGLLRDVLMGALFDRSVTDAWTAAFRLPNLMRRLFGEGALSVSFIPEFIESKSQDLSGKEAKNLVNSVYTILLLVVGSLTLLGFIYIEPLFRFLLSDSFVQDSQRWEMTLRMGRIMLGFVFFVIQYAYFMGVLNALGSFALPAAAPALLNVSMLVFTLMPGELFPQYYDGLAWGVLVGGIIQTLILVPALKWKGYLPRFQLKSIHPKTGSIFRKMGPGLVGIGVLQISTIINLYFASGLGEGVLSQIYWADRLLEFPLSLISVSIGAALLPTLSVSVANKDRGEFKLQSTHSLLMNLFLSVPCAAGLYVLAEPIIEVLFMRGLFTQADVVATAVILKIYALALVFISLNRVLAPLFFAHKDTWTPMLAGIIGLVFHAISSFLLVDRFGVRGLMYSVCLMNFVTLIYLVTQVPRKTFGIFWGELSRGFCKTGFAAGGMALVAAMTYYPLAFKAGSWQNIIVLFACIGTSGTCYFILSLGLKNTEALKFKKLFLQKIKSRL